MFVLASAAGCPLAINRGYKGARDMALPLAAVPWLAALAVATFEGHGADPVQWFTHFGSLMVLTISYAGVATGILAATALQEGALAIRSLWRSSAEREDQ